MSTPGKPQAKELPENDPTVVPLEPRGRGRPKGSRNRVKKEVAVLFDPVARKMTRKVAKRLDEELERGDKANLDFVVKIYTLACN